VAVFERHLAPWDGAATPRRRRFLVVARYARREVFASRFVTAFYALCFAPLLAAAGFIYLRYNLAVLTVIQVPVDQFVPVDARFFHIGLQGQGFLAFLLTAMIGPGLVAPDLANNGLALILSRPFSRADYVLGKLAVLGAVLSSVTWLPIALLVLLEASLDDAPGLAGHGRTLAAVVAGGTAWVLVLALLVLALSAWVRWKTLAAALLAAVFFVSRAMGAVMNQVFDTRWGDLVDLSALVRTAWDGLFYGGPPEGIPYAAAWAGLAAGAGACLALLARKLRPYEVVR
jgi:ABC-2 type transport system permease protein